jgi:antitoxin (DNA-binding transcriptional repressor) of toxin-antitoxin stability system
MSRNTFRVLIPVAVAAVAAAQLAAGPACAATQSRPAASAPGGAFYRCKSSNGLSFVGQAIPDECIGMDVEVLDHGGRVIRIIPGQRSNEQIDQQKAEMDARNAAAQRDRTLLATYLSVADIERLRDQRVELLEQQALVTQQYIQNLHAREARLMQDVQRYRPYSPNPKAPPLPDTLAEELVNTVNGLRVYEQELTKNTAEQQQLRASFGADITRFKELKGLQ